jgi:hypothetical protein
LISTLLTILTRAGIDDLIARNDRRHQDCSGERVLPRSHCDQRDLGKLVDDSFDLLGLYLHSTDVHQAVVTTEKEDPVPLHVDAIACVDEAVGVALETVRSEVVTLGARWTDPEPTRDDPDLDSVRRCVQEGGREPLVSVVDREPHTGLGRRIDVRDARARVCAAQ